MKNLWVAISVVVVVVVAGLAVLLFWGREPQHEGKPLSMWRGDLLSTDIKVRAAALNAIEAMDKDAAKAVPDLIEILKKEKNPKARSKACLSLWNIGSRAKDAVNDLIYALDHDKSAEVRFNAAGALGGIGPDAAYAAPALGRALKDTDKDVRFQAAESLKVFGSEAKGAVGDLINAIKTEPEPDNRIEEVGALEEIGPEAREALPALRELLNTDDGELRGAAVRAIRAIEGKSS
jgi:HEAT repeat protein